MALPASSVAQFKGGSVEELARGITSRARASKCMLGFNRYLKTIQKQKPFKVFSHLVAALPDLTSMSITVGKNRVRTCSLGFLFVGSRGGCVQMH